MRQQSRVEPAGSDEIGDAQKEPPGGETIYLLRRGGRFKLEAHPVRMNAAIQQLAGLHAIAVRQEKRILALLQQEDPLG